MPYFQAFQPVSVTVTFFMNSITFVMNHLFSYFDISICHSSNRTLSYRLLLTHGFNHGYVLGGCCYIHLTKRTYIKQFGLRTDYSMQRLPCIHTLPLNLLPISGSPRRSLSLMHTSKRRSLHNNFNSYIISCVYEFRTFV